MDIAACIARLTGKNAKDAYAFAQQIAAESRESDIWYLHFDQFASLLLGIVAALNRGRLPDGFCTAFLHHRGVRAVPVYEPVHHVHGGRFTRNEMVEVMDSDCVRLAESKGLYGSLWCAGTSCATPWCPSRRCWPRSRKICELLFLERKSGQKEPSLVAGVSSRVKYRAGID